MNKKRICSKNIFFNSKYNTKASFMGLNFLRSFPGIKIPRKRRIEILQGGRTSKCHIFEFRSNQQIQQFIKLMEFNKQSRSLFKEVRNSHSNRNGSKNLFVLLILPILLKCFRFYIKFMKSTQHSNNLTNNKLEILRGLANYREDEGNHQIWVQIFQLTKKCCVDVFPVQRLAQNHVNNYLRKSKEENHILRPYILNSKHLLANLFDMVRDTYCNVDEGITGGRMKQMLLHKYEKHLQGLTNAKLEELIICVEAIVIHIVQLFQRIHHIKQQGNLFFSNQSQLISEKKVLHECIIAKPVFVVFQIPSQQKIKETPLSLKELLINENHQLQGERKCLLIYTSKMFDEKRNICQMVTVKEILQTCQLTHKNTVEELMNQFSLTPYFYINSETKHLKHQLFKFIFILPDEGYCSYLTHLCPSFMKPRSNTDLLSYLNFQPFSTFKLSIYQPGTFSEILISQLMTVYYNNGNSPFYIISFSQNLEKVQEYKFNSLSQIKLLERRGLIFGKVKVRPFCYGIVPIGKPHIIYFPQKISNMGSFIFWQILPKASQIFIKFIKTRELLSSKGKKYSFPIFKMLLNVLSHEHYKIDQQPFHKTIRTFLEQEFENEAELIKSLSSKYPNLSAKMSKYGSQSNCSQCSKEILNFFVKNNEEKTICLECGLLFHDQPNLYYSYDPESLKMPVYQSKIPFKKKKQSDKGNKYEKNCCFGKFVGDIEEERCFSESNARIKKRQEKQLEEVFEWNKKLNSCVTCEELFLLIVEMDSKNQKVEQLCDEMRFYYKIFSYEQNQILIQEVMKRYKTENMAMRALHELNDRKQFQL